MRARLGAVLTVGAPVVLFGLLAWDRRWMSDDGYINLRVVWNVLHGHGPVFNIGERVEAGTSPLWILVLVVARILLWWVDPGWVAVLTGIALTLVGVALAIVGARSWWRSLGREATLPLGAVALVALPPMWDFASSGLETGLTFAWLGGCWAALAGRLRHETPPRVCDPFWLPVLVGLGPLVRPDLALVSLVFAVALVATSAVDRRGALRALAVGAAAPVAYQLFRMGYYGLLVPNTALAKEADQALWGRGWTYLRLYLESTGVVLFLLALAVAFAVALIGAKPGRRHVIVAAAPVAAAAVHLLYIVRVGGDFMFARMLLPATFALVCPVAALPAPAWRPEGRRVATGVLGVASIAAVVVAVVVAGGRESFGDDDTLGGRVVDERDSWVFIVENPHPVSVGDFDRSRMLSAALRGLPVPGMLFEMGRGTTTPAPETAVVTTTLGYMGVHLVGTRVVDGASLSEPIGAHLRIAERWRAGHEKPMPRAWIVARHASPDDPGPEVAAAIEALTCGDLAELVDAVEEPLTPGRFLRNLVGSVDRTRLRIPRDPVAARDDFCE